MAIIVNIIAALILFIIPIRAYSNKDGIIVKNPFEDGGFMRIDYPLYFLVFSVLTAMVFLGPLSLVKYAVWIVFLLFLTFSGHIQIRINNIINCYFLFLGWLVFSSVFFSTVKFDALMMIVKYSLPLFYLWLGYSSINDQHDIMFFMKKVAIGMCVYALIIGGFSAKFLSPLYGLLNFSSGGLFISYASLADYFSGLIVVPIALYLVTRSKKWLYATLWVILSTVLESVRTGLGGIFLACSLFFVTVFRGKAIPWIAGMLFAAVITVFAVPSIRHKMFMDENTTMSSLTASDASFEKIQSNGREFLWEINLNKFYEPHKITGAGLGESSAWMKNRPGLHLIHSDYVQMLCDVGLIGITLFGVFVIVTILSIISVSWQSDTPYMLKLTGGMALGSCAGTFFSMAFDNVVAYAQQSFVIPFILIGIYMKCKDLYESGEIDWNDELEWV